jgi:hypothetical protein
MIVFFLQRLIDSQSRTSIRTRHPNSWTHSLAESIQTGLEDSPRPFLDLCVFPPPAKAFRVCTSPSRASGGNSAAGQIV